MEQTLTSTIAPSPAAVTVSPTLPNAMAPIPLLTAATILPPHQDPSTTIAALSASLATAQASITRLAAELQQVQLGSVSGVASAQSSAFSVVASVSSSAAAALASASAQVANANAMAMAASRVADVAMANASSIQVGESLADTRCNQIDNMQAQADLSRQLDPTQFTEAQLSIAVAVSIIGTLVLALIGFLIYVCYRERRRRLKRQPEKNRPPKNRPMMLRPTTGNSSDGGEPLWTVAYAKGPPRANRPPRYPLGASQVRGATPRGPPNAPLPRPPDVVNEERETQEWPMSTVQTPPTTSKSNSPGPFLSLFPRMSETDTGPPQSPPMGGSAQMTRSLVRYDSRGSRGT